MDGTSTLEIYLQQGSWSAVNEARRLGEKALAAILRFSQDENFQKRQVAMISAGAVGKGSAGQILAAGLTDKNINVRLSAAKQLEEKPIPGTAGIVLEQLEQSQDDIVREILALAAGWIPGEKTFDVLRKIVAADNGQLSVNAQMALAKLGDTESLRAILTQLRDELPRARYNALEKLIYIGDPKLERYARPLLNDKEPAVMIGTVKNPKYRRVCDQAVDTIVTLLNLRVSFPLSVEKIYSERDIFEVISATS